MGKKAKLSSLETAAAPEATNGVQEKALKKRKKDKTQAAEEDGHSKKLKIVDLNGGEDTSGKQKKKKSKKSDLGEPEAVDASNGVKDDIGEDSTVPKKKKKKNRDAAGGLGDTELAESAEGAGEETEQSNGKKQKKDKKKAKAGADAAVDAADAPGLPNLDGVKVKKKKKGKSGAVENGEGADAVEKKEGGDATRRGGDLGGARAALNMVVTGRDANAETFAPLQSFEEANLPEVLLHGCAGFSTPSPIQAQAWPISLAGRDLVGIAKTGSGKTIAFAVPALSHITKLGKPPKQPACLVLAPTRELAIQIAEVFENAGQKCGVKTVCVYGGVPKGPQKAAIRGGATVVVATPGRLQDLTEEGACTLSQCGMLVLDEADRMLDLGFEPAIRKIIAMLPKAHQTSMFSATWPPEVAKLAAEFLRDPLKITIGSEDLTANHDVTQIVEVCEPTGREPKLEQLLRKYHADRKKRVLVFVLYKKEAAQMESYLTRKGWKAVAIHGDKGQVDRSRALQQFRDGTIPLLIATDVAARGLDIPNVEYVINYSFPLTAEDYVHRIGRTGRAGKKGLAHTFFTVNDKARAGELQNILREAGQKVPEALTAFGTTVKKKESKLYGAHFREVDMDAKATKISFDSDDE